MRNRTSGQSNLERARRRGRWTALKLKLLRAKRGIVYVTKEHPRGDWRRDPLDGDYRTHWELDEGGFVTGPSSDDIEEAIAWARKRARLVLVRLGSTDDNYYSAGERTVTRELPELGGTDLTPYPDWPPPGWPGRHGV